jgi:hypothetical protein
MPIIFKSIDLGRLKIVPGEYAMSQIGLSYKADMRARVEFSGLGSDGEPMQPYTRAYAEFRNKAGRGTSFRTLVFTQQMLHAFGLKKATDTSALLGWGPGEESVKALANETRTPFVAPTPDEKRALIKRVKMWVKRKIEVDLAAARATKK